VFLKKTFFTLALYYHSGVILHLSRFEFVRVVSVGGILLCNSYTLLLLGGILNTYSVMIFRREGLFKITEWIIIVE